MFASDFNADAGPLKGLKVSCLELRENELRIAFKGRHPDNDFQLALRGIIGFQDAGVLGRPLRGYEIEDRGSFKVIRFHRGDGNTLLSCEYLESDIR